MLNQTISLVIEDKARYATKINQDFRVDTISTENVEMEIESTIEVVDWVDHENHDTRTLIFGVDNHLHTDNEIFVVRDKNHHWWKPVSFLNLMEEVRVSFNEEMKSSRDHWRKRRASPERLDKLIKMRFLNEAPIFIG